MYAKNLKIIITGSEGLIGTQLKNFLQENNEIFSLDLSLGHDLSDENFVKKWFSENKADCIINCFGLNDHVEDNEKRSTLFDISLDSFSDFLHVNLTSLFSVCREYARNNASGSIVNFSATTGLVSPRPELYDDGHKHVGYTVSKAGVINLTKFLAVHLAPSVRVNCLAPGGVESSQSKDFKKNYSKHTPLDRMMKPTELNGIVDFLCSSHSSYVTGATYVVDGGWTSW